MTRAVIYSRVSSEGSRQDTERQTNELVEYANTMGYELVWVYEEKVSGFKKNNERPIFSRMLDDLKSQKIDKVLVWELSRIGRNVVQSLQNIQLLTDKKVSIYIKNFNLETLNEDKTPNGLSLFMVQILFSVASMESQLTLSRLQSGYRSLIDSQGSKAVGRKAGSIETEEETIQKHSDILKLLKRNLSIRQVAGLTKKSTNTVLKVRKSAIGLNLL
ncbi:recombinase family protein [Flavobacterium sp.]|jgi:DNA invertase Pin-like site-specific DNA recombinase|uniref:recombinase family protein n=1 Tax=Flavobacterium sp. TaxID=239 RepID=UPI0037C04F2E